MRGNTSQPRGVRELTIEADVERIGRTILVRRVIPVKTGIQDFLFSGTPTCAGATS